MQNYNKEMLIELFEYVTSDCSKESKRLGFLGQSISLRHRSKRLEKNWAYHQNQCKEFCSEKVDPAKPQSILVLGSFEAQEIPLLKWLGDGHQVTLVDIVHPPAIKKMAAANRASVKLIQADLSHFVGASSWIQKSKRVAAEDIIEVIQASQLQLGNFDICFSTNLISQLVFLPIRFLLKLNYTETEVTQIGRAIIHRHLGDLKQSASQAFYFTDVERIETNRHGHEVERNSTVLESSLPGFEKNWLWNFAPSPELHSKNSYQLLVKAGKI